MPRATAAVRDDYPGTIAGLWSLCALAPLRTRAAYNEAAALCGRLAVRRLNAAQSEYFRDLLSIVEAYEDARGEEALMLAKLRRLTAK